MILLITLLATIAFQIGYCLAMHTATKHLRAANDLIRSQNKILQETQDEILREKLAEKVEDEPDPADWWKN